MEKFEDMVKVEEAQKFGKGMYEARLSKVFSVLHEWFAVINHVSDNTDDKKLRKELVGLQENLLKQFNTFDKSIETKIEKELKNIG